MRLKKINCLAFEMHLRFSFTKENKIPSTVTSLVFQISNTLHTVFLNHDHLIEEIIHCMPTFAVLAMEMKIKLF